MALPLAGAALAAAIPAAASAVGVERTNRANRAMAREQMGFQERMSNTAWQRAVQDMRLAGINPMLAFQQGGASSPPGAMATMEDSLGAATSSAKAGARLRQEMRVMKAQEQAAVAAAHQSLSAGHHQTRQAQIIERLMEAGMPEAQADQIRALVRQSGAQSDLLELQKPGWENIARIEGADAGQVGSIIRWLIQMIGGRRP